MLYRNPSHGMSCGTWRQFVSAFSSDQCTISSPPKRIWFDGERKRTPPVRYAKADRPHSLSSCKIALSQGRYTWRHNNVLDVIISTVKGETTLPETNALIGRLYVLALKIDERNKPEKNCLLDGCVDSDASTDLPEWVSHPNEED